MSKNGIVDFGVFFYFLPKLFLSLFELFAINFIVIKNYKAFRTFFNVLFKKINMIEKVMWGVSPAYCSGRGVAIVAESQINENILQENWLTFLW